MNRYIQQKRTNWITKRQISMDFVNVFLLGVRKKAELLVLVYINLILTKIDNRKIEKRTIALVAKNG